MRRNYGNSEFIDSEETQGLRYIILQSGRLAFHWAIEAFVMGDMELSDFKTFEDEVNSYDKDWFLGSEEYLWNSAIERSLPNLERLIQKKDGSYFAHRLRFG